MSDWADPASDSLAARAASGIVLVAVGLSAAYFGGAWLSAATGAALTAMAFEFARMSEPKSPLAAFAIAWVGGLAAIWTASWGAFSWTLACLGAAAGLTALRPAPMGRRFEAAFGVLYVGVPCAAFVWLRGTPNGLDAVLALFAIIWAADIAAYFAGRFIGGPRIAPSLSPNKTWAGIIGGATAGACAGLGLYAFHGGPAAAWLVLGAGLASVGLMGDLFESLLKRRYGVKDASNLIPGHGGVMDRLDGLMAAVLAAAALVALAPQAPDALFGGRL